MAWTTPTHDPNNYSAMYSMYWTVATADVRTMKYKMLDTDTMALQFYIIESTTGGTAATQLKFKIPNGKKALGYFTQHISCWTDHQETPEPGVASTAPNDTWIYLNNRGFIDGGQLWSLDANCHTWACGQMLIEVGDA